NDEPQPFAGRPVRRGYRHRRFVLVRVVRVSLSEPSCRAASADRALAALRVGGVKTDSGTVSWAPGSKTIGEFHAVPLRRVRGPLRTPRIRGRLPKIQGPGN